MKGKSLVAVLIATLMLIAAEEPASAQRSRLDRPGTIGIHIFGGYGTVTGNSRYGLDFGEGAGFGVSVRYTMAPHWALGFYFQSQRYKHTRVQEPDEEPIDDLRHMGLLD